MAIRAPTRVDESRCCRNVLSTRPIEADRVSAASEYGAEFRLDLVSLVVLAAVQACVESGRQASGCPITKSPISLSRTLRVAWERMFCVGDRSQGPWPRHGGYRSDRGAHARRSPARTFASNSRISLKPTAFMRSCRIDSPAPGRSSNSPNSASRSMPTPNPKQGYISICWR